MATVINEDENLDQSSQSDIRQLVPPQEAFDKQHEIEMEYIERINKENK